MHVANRLQKERFLSCGQQLFKFIGTKERVYRRKEFNSQTIGLEHQDGRPFNVVGHQHGRHDVSIVIMLCSLAQGYCE